MNSTYIIYGIIGTIIIFLIGFLIDYINKYKQSLLRESIKDVKLKALTNVHDKLLLKSYDDSKVYSILTDLLLTQPIVYARGSMRKFYEIRANGVIYTRVRISKMNEAPKRENVQGELYFIWSNNQYISKIQLIQALGYKDPKLIIKYINENLVTIEDLKKAEKGSNLKTQIRTRKPYNITDKK